MAPCDINKTLLPIKASYFLYFAGLACTFPHLPIFFVSLGITVWQVGVLRGIDPILTFVCCPIWGGLADRFSKHRLCLTIATIGTGIMYFSFIFVPYIAPPPTTPPASYDVHNVSQCSWESVFAERPHCPEGRASTFTEKMTETDPLPYDYCDQVCFAAAGVTAAHKIFGVCSSVWNGDVTDWRCRMCDIDDVDAGDVRDSTAQHLVAIYCRSTSVYESLLSEESEHMASERLDLLSYLDYERCTGTDCCECDIVKVDHEAQNGNQLAYLICFILLLLANTFDCNIQPYIDAIVMDMLGDNEQDFGKQRLWGAVGWGLIAFVGGLTVDAFTRASGTSDFRYEPLFVIFAISMTLFLIGTIFIELPPHHQPSKMGKNLLVILRKPASVMFLVILTVEGAVVAINYSFVFIYWQQDLGASMTVISLSILATVISETPMLYVSGRIVERIGYRGVVYLTLAAFSLRFLCYGLIRNPWAVLPVQLLDGVTFGIGWPGFTMYASQIAPEGMSATLQSSKTSAYFGVGFILGNFIGGFVYEKYGPLTLFFGNTVLCILTAVVFFAVDKLVCDLGSSDLENTSPKDNTSDDVISSTGDFPLSDSATRKG